MPLGTGPDENLSCVAKKGKMSDAITSRIVGGNIGIFAPYQIFLRYRMKEPKKGGGSCGGTILNKRHILTARHCVVMMTNDTEVIVNPKTADIKVIVGETDRCKAVGVDNIDEFSASLFSGKFESVKDVADVYIHSDDDLAIIKVKSALTLSSCKSNFVVRLFPLTLTF